MARRSPIAMQVVWLLAVWWLYGDFPKMLGAVLSWSGAQSGLTDWTIEIVRPLLALALFRLAAGKGVGLAKQGPVTCWIIAAGLLCAWAPALAQLSAGEPMNSLTARDAIALGGVSLVAALHVAVMEEVLFRGFLFHWVSRIARPALALALQGALFAVLHIRAVADYPLLGFLYFFAFAGILNLMSVAAGSLCPSIALHFSFDFASMVAYGLNRHGVGYRGLLDRENSDPHFWIAATALLLTLLALTPRFGIVSMLAARRRGTVPSGRQPALALSPS